jgi:hypothetical protein
MLVATARRGEGELRTRLAIRLAVALGCAMVFASVGCRSRARVEHERYLREVAAARKAGIPLTPNDLRMPEPPNGTNAAPVWRRVSALLGERPLEYSDRVAIEWPDRAAPPPGPAAMREVMRRRLDLVALVHKAVERPRCVFHREWSKGIDLGFPEHYTVRLGAYVVCAEGRALLAAGEPEAAVHRMAAGFNIARQLDDEPSTHAGCRVGMLANVIMLTGMGEVLRADGERPGVAREVLRALENWKPGSLRRALGSDVVMHCAFIDQLRRGGLDYLLGFAREVRAGTRAERTAEWNAELDGEGVQILSRMRAIIAAVDLPYQVAQGAIAAACRRSVKQQDQMRLLGAVFAMRYPILPAKVAEERALVDTIRASASLFIWKAQHGAFPDRLAQALPELPRDPFDQQPLRYRREGTGFVIWSVGPTGRFDGGQPGSMMPANEVAFRYPGRSRR